MMLVRAAMLDRSLRENLSPVWICFGAAPSFFSVYGLIRQKSIDPGRTAKRVDARYTWRELDAFSHKSKRLFYPTPVSLYFDGRAHATLKDQVIP